MNNKTIAVVLGVILVFGGVYLGFSKMKGSEGVKNPAMENGNDSGVETTSPDAQAETGKKMAFGEFMKQGGSYTCTVIQSVGGMDSAGIIYISGSLVRGDFNTSIQGMNLDNSFLLKDNYTYTWSSAMGGQGFQTKVTELQQTGEAPKASGQYSFNSEQIGDYECKNWNADNSKFALPVGIKFTLVK